MSIIRSSFSDWFGQFIPSPKVPETKGILKNKTKKINDYEDDGLDEDSPEELEKAAKKEKLIIIPEEFEFTDLTKEPRTKKRGESKGKRKWKNVKGITLHQTAVDFGTNPRRMLNVPVHGATLKDGKIVLLHTPTDYMWHAHSLNKYDIGIEVSCRTAGILGNSKTFWRSKREKENEKKYKDLVSDPTNIQLEATKELCRYYIQLVKENGGEIKFIHAHRQGHKSRVSDPGSLIWQKVAIPIMEEFGLSSGPVGWKIGSGKPIPQVWDVVRGKGIEYTWNIKGF